MKKYTIQTRDNETYKVSLDDIKMGDCYDCGRPEWAYEPMVGDENAFLAAVLPVEVAHVELDNWHNDYCKTAPYKVLSVELKDGSELTEGEIVKDVEKRINESVDYDSLDGPYIYAEVDGEKIVLDGDEAWFEDDVEAEVRKLLRCRAVGDCVYVARLHAGLSQQQLSDKANVARCNIAKLERGYYNASIDVLTRIATALDCELTFKKC